MNAKITSLIFLVLSLTCWTVRADEWIDSDGDGEIDTLVLDTFTVSDSDPSTFDWAGYWDDQIRQMQDQQAAELQDWIDRHIDDFIDSANSLINENGTTALIPPENVDPRAVGNVAADGRGGWEVVFRPDRLQSQFTSDPRVLDIIHESVNRHEGRHAQDALAQNPGIFDTFSAGWIFAARGDFGNQTEINAHNDQLAYLNEQLDSGTLSPDEQSLIEEYKSLVEADLHSYGG